MLDHEKTPPFEVIASTDVVREWNLALRRDRVRWPDGPEAEYRVIEGPDAVFVVPYLPDGNTVLVRQWRHPWNATSWEVPAGTLEVGEEPLAGAQRELEEEVGLVASSWKPLGITRGSGLVSGRQHLFLASSLSRVQRAPEPGERDMVVRELAFRTALDAALRGDIEHAASVSAIVRAARVLGII
ncbi:MAG TPA: NUDIX hydrolase [Candidatus Dormibacteraeota bacterium]|nr:NUDIX hydrolase [Candidatus Dormibacteraeota bacterium]